MEISTDLDMSSSNMLFGTATKDVPREEAGRGVRHPFWTMCGNAWSAVGSLFSTDRRVEWPCKLNSGISFLDCAVVRAWKRLTTKMESLLAHR